MDSFSERMGLRKSLEIRLETMDVAMRNALWNAFYTFLKRFYAISSSSTYTSPDDAYNILSSLSVVIWKDYFGNPLDEIDNTLYDISTSYLHPKVLAMVKSHLLKNGKWYEVYDFLEFFVNISSPYIIYNDILRVHIEEFVNNCNTLFKQYGYPYRFEKFDNLWIIVPKMSTYEVEEISRAASNEKIPLPTRKHLQDAIEFYKMRGTPKYAESMGESIKAVESLIRYILNDNTITLSKGIDKLKDCLDSHLREAIKNIYWKTSDDWGARHGFGPGDSEATLEDTRFILVVSSAIVNYLADKVLNNPECRGEANE